MASYIQEDFIFLYSSFCHAEQQRLSVGSHLFELHFQSPLTFILKTMLFRIRAHEKNFSSLKHAGRLQITRGTGGRDTLHLCTRRADKLPRYSLSMGEGSPRCSGQHYAESIGTARLRGPEFNSPDAPIKVRSEVTKLAIQTIPPRLYFKCFQFFDSNHNRNDNIISDLRRGEK